MVAALHHSFLAGRGVHFAPHLEFIIPTGYLTTCTCSFLSPGFCSFHSALLDLPCGCKWLPSSLLKALFCLWNPKVLVGFLHICKVPSILTTLLPRSLSPTLVETEWCCCRSRWYEWASPWFTGTLHAAWRHQGRRGGWWLPYFVIDIQTVSLLTWLREFRPMQNSSSHLGSCHTWWRLLQ